MARRFWFALVGIAACVLLPCFGIAACSAPKAVFTSSYDVAGMLASNPRSVAEALERMNFEVAGPDANSWENEELLNGIERAHSASLTFGGLSADDLSGNRTPDRATLAFFGSPYADDRMVGKTTSNLMDLADVEKPFYNERAADDASDSLVRRLVGRVDKGKEPAAYWSLEVYQHEASDALPFEFSDYYLTAWTEEAARESENAWMQDALAAENA